MLNIIEQQQSPIPAALASSKLVETLGIRGFRTIPHGFAFFVREMTAPVSFVTVEIREGKYDVTFWSLCMNHEVPSLIASSLERGVPIQGFESWLTYCLTDPRWLEEEPQFL